MSADPVLSPAQLVSQWREKATRWHLLARECWDPHQAKHFDAAAKEREECADQLEASLRAQQTWQPIETAPKNKPLLLKEDGAPLGYFVPHIFVGIWRAHKAYAVGGCWREVYRDFVGNPTHWMSLPEGSQG